MIPLFFFNLGLMAETVDDMKAFIKKNGYSLAAIIILVMVLIMAICAILNTKKIREAYAAAKWKVTSADSSIYTGTNIIRSGNSVTITTTNGVVSIYNPVKVEEYEPARRESVVIP